MSSLVETAHQAFQHAIESREPDAWLVAEDAWSEAGYPVLAHMARFASRLDSKIRDQLNSRDVMQLYFIEPSAATSSPPLLPGRLVQLTPTRIHTYPLAFPVMQISPGGSAITTAQPEVPFRATRLVLACPDAGLSTLGVTAIKVGRQNQTLGVTAIKVGRQNQTLGGQGEIPATLFSASAFPFPMNLDTADISHPIAIHIRHHVVHQPVAGRPLTVFACMLGRAVE